jgi:hypothetical protein
MTQTIKFATFPFTHKGIDFVSRISEQSRFLPQIMMMGEAFIEMNKQAIDELISLTDETTHEELVALIAHINDGGTEMFLELAGA